MELDFNFDKEINEIQSRKKSLSPFRSFLYNWFAKVGWWFVLPLLVDTIIVVCVMYVIDSNLKFELLSCIIAFGCTAVLYSSGMLLAHLICRKSNGKSVIIQSLTNILIELKYNKGEVYYALKQYDKASTSDLKDDYIKYAYLSLKSIIKVVQYETEVLTKKLDSEKTASSIYVTELRELGELSERLNSCVNDFWRVREKLITEIAIE